MKIHFKPLSISLLISLGVGAASAFVTRNSMDIYKSIKLPPLSPPSIAFPIVWTILFILMGIAAYLIYISNSKNKGSALKFYGIQLLLNFIWPIIFFNMRSYLFAFIWLILLILFILKTFTSFKAINKKAAYLLIPYILWIIFAGYLNIAIYFLNR